MNRRLLSASILLLTLVTSAAGNLLATAFCPGMSRLGAGCHNAVPKSHSSHSDMSHEMHAMHMSDGSMTGEQTNVAPAQAADLLLKANGVEQPLGNCSHCVSHSNLPRGALALRQTAFVRPFDDVDEPVLFTNLVQAVLTPRPVTARQHAPPGASSPLHVRINVFRI